MVNNDERNGADRPTRVLIINAFYEDTVGYQEVQLATVLRRSGYDVLVIASDRANHDRSVRYVDPPGAGIHRITRLIRVKNTFLPLESVRAHVRAFDPHIAFVIHPNAGLPYFFLGAIPPSCRVISFFGDLMDKNKVGRADTKGNALIQKYLKDRWYNATFRRSDVIVANTNETVATLKAVATSPIADKIVMPGLGFDPTVYHRSPELRSRTRAEYGLRDDDVVLLTVTRVYPGKPVSTWFREIEREIKAHPNLVYLFAGFLDAEHSRAMAAEIEAMGFGAKVRLLNFTTAAQNNALFNAADYSLWYAPTISIQQSMASGLPAIIPHDSTVDHLVEPGRTGLFFEDFDGLRSHLRSLGPWPVERSAVAKANERFSYENIVRFLFSRVKPPDGPLSAS